MSCCLGRSRCNWQVPLWISAFTTWYLFYVVSFCAVLSKYESSVTLVLVLQAFNIIWITAVVSLFRAAFYPAEPIPEIFRFPEELLSEENVFSAIGEWSKKHRVPVRFHTQPTSDGEVECPSFCSACCVVKPDRAHHCRQCGRCIMRMDHHCPVLGNCVHFHNHNFFINFLASATALCLFAVIVISPRLYEVTNTIFEETSLQDYGNPNAYICIASGVMNAGVCLFALSWFLHNLIKQMMRNETTLECCRKDDYGDQGIYRDGRSDYSLGNGLLNCRSFMLGGWNWIFPVNVHNSAKPYLYECRVVNSKME